MCGILGWIHPALSDTAQARRSVGPALQALRRRGPDGQGIAAGPGWLLGHTRLAILDLTSAADQPMTDGRGKWLVFNGEIYNFQQLRRELESHGHTFRSSGDTEVVLKALCQWGAGALSRLRGMFALAFLDAQANEMLLARDRYGVKPLCYEAREEEFRFGSDLFAMRSLPNPPTAVDSEAAYLFMGLGYIPAPYTILAKVRKVRPGCFLRVRWDAAGQVGMEEQAYWSLASIPAAEVSERVAQELLADYDIRAAEAVESRLVSDVPVGTLLSGGIDSSLVTAYCREKHGNDVPSFTMGFEDPVYDEAPFARRIADRLGGGHHEFRLTEAEALQEWSRLCDVYDEPFADPSAIPMMSLCRGIAADVKVALCGDGGDETFGGYPWHRALDRAERQPLMVRRASALASQLPSVISWDQRYKLRVVSQSDRIGQWSALRTGLSDGEARRLPVEGASRRPPFREYFQTWARPLAEVSDPIDWACRMDLLTYLPDDLMVKSDRASMHVGLELREPFLDHPLTEWVLRQPVPSRYDRRTRTSKLLPRAALARRIPREYFERPKQGFTPPTQQWLEGPLAEAVRQTMTRLQTGELAPLHLTRKATIPSDPRGQFLWRTLCFAAWLDHHAALRPQSLVA